MFQAFIWANNIGSQLINKLIKRVKISNPFPSFNSSSPSGGGMSDKSTDSFLSVDSSLSVDFRFSKHGSQLYVWRKNNRIIFQLYNVFLASNIGQCIDQNRFLANCHIILKLYYTHSSLFLFFFFVLFVCVYFQLIKFIFLEKHLC